MKELLSRILPKEASQTLADQMEEHYLPSLLEMIDADAYETVKRLGKMIPVALTGFWGYEISLSDNSRQADVLFCVHDARAFQKAFTDVKSFNEIKYYPTYNSIWWVRKKTLALI